MSGVTLNNRIKAFARLGEVMADACLPDPLSVNGKAISKLAKSQERSNPWFTAESVINSLAALASNLKTEKLIKWLSGYSLNEINSNPQHIGVVMAGNIPLVGFHDFLSVLITGNILVVKTSSRDSEIITELSRILCGIDPSFNDMILFSQDKIVECNAVIATGSNNSSRYFEYSYGNVPHLFRKNRNSVAIIEESTSPSDLVLLGKDIFSYYGLGCRNVSKLYVPSAYNLERLKISWHDYAVVKVNIPYRNNLDHYRALYIVGGRHFHDLGFLLLTEDESFSSPVSVLNISRYNNISSVEVDISDNRSLIQAIVGDGHLPFGQSQSPSLTDYADGVDTIDFLLRTGK